MSIPAPKKSWSIALPWALAIGLSTGCSDDVDVTMADIAGAGDKPASNLVQGQIDLTKVCDDVTITSATGVPLQGTMDCAMLHTSTCSEAITSGCYVTSASAADGGAHESATEPLVAVKASSLQASDIRLGVTIGPVTGTYSPEAAPAPAPAPASAPPPAPPPTCTADGEVGCVTDNDFKAVAVANVVAANLRTGTTIAGVAGTLGDCIDGAEGVCVLPAAYKAVVSADLSEGKIKAAETIGGVTGKYPSVAYKLPGAGISGAALDGTNFEARAKATTATEFWKADGRRETFFGTANIIPSNIKKDVSIFGVTGSYDAAAIAIEPNDLRKGVTYGGVTGTLVVDCSGANCTEGKNFKDVSVDANDKTTPKLCPHLTPLNQLGGIDCLAKDKITGFIWTHHLGSDTHANAVAFCSNLNAQNYGGLSTGWHLPDRAELGQARLHGLGYFDFKLFNNSIYTRSATEDPDNPGNYFLIEFKNFGTPLPTNGSISFVCVNSGS